MSSGGFLLSCFLLQTEQTTPEKSAIQLPHGKANQQEFSRQLSWNLGTRSEYFEKKPEKKEH